LIKGRKKFKQFQIPIGEDHKKGVYSIILNNDIYIGSTNTSFRERFLQHINKNNPLKHTYDLLINGGIFNTLWIATDNEDERNIRKKENEYIEEYKNNPYWNVINFKDSYKIKYKNIKVKAKDYNSAIKVLQSNNIYYKK